MGFNLFITNLFSDDPSDRFFFFTVVVTVIISIVLHELAHGWAAIKLGDNTPILQNRMTGNPMVHMGPYALLALAIAGFAWGQMPVDPTRLRGKFAEAYVALAGPITNILLALACLTPYALWLRFGGIAPDNSLADNAQTFLWIAGAFNLLLAAFNLLPIPPLDGSRVVANLYRPYARFVGDPANYGAIMIGFFFAFALGGAVLMPACLRLASEYVYLIRTLGA